MRTAAVIQAAGKGSRFHSNQYKLLTDICGQPLIVRTLQPVLEVGFDEIVVVIGAHADEMRNVLVDYPVKIVENKKWETGQSSSLCTGVNAIINSSDRACLMLGDQPYLKAETLRALVKESDGYPNDIIVPFYKNMRGNPIIIPSCRYRQLLELSHGDHGGKQLLITVGYRELSVVDKGILRDIDTVEELRGNE